MQKNAKGLTLRVYTELHMNYHYHSARTNNFVGDNMEQTN